jgi:hypothetical protein
VADVIRQACSLYEYVAKRTLDGYTFRAASVQLPGTAGKTLCSLVLAPRQPPLKTILLLHTSEFDAGSGARALPKV